MSEPTVVETPAAPSAKVAAPKKKTSKTKGASAKSTHPKVSMMVNTAIVNLKERGGSSLQAIKKYIAANYKVDAEKLAPFIRKHLKTSVVNGSLIQTKGKGASGSFKVGGSKKEGPAPKVTKKVVAKTQAVKAKAPKVKKVAVKKTKPVRAAKPKRVSKVKAKKSPAKAPKPKKTMKAKGGKSKAPKQKK